MHLVSLQTGLPEERVTTVQDGENAHWTSAIFKTPVSGARRLDWTQIEGDGQANLVHHGGPDKAVNCYSVEHYPGWRDALGLDAEIFGYGAFGENFTVAGMTEEAVSIGDIYTVGSATVQVSQPRQPCYKLGRRWELASFPRDVIASGKTGYYLRVLRPGTVEAGDRIELIDRPEADWTIARANDAFYNRQDDKDLARALADLPTLAESWREVFQSRLVR